MDVSAVFVPEPLRTSSHVRLLKFLFPKRSDDTITFQIVQTQLDDASAIDYVALSHAWGVDRELTEHVICDGKKHAVTARLYSTLQRIRALAASRDHWAYLWVDAICINQATDSEALRERASQVSIMSKIFGRAIEVVVDLGEAMDQSTAMMEVDALKLASETDSRTLFICIAVMRGAIAIDLDISGYPITPYLRFCSAILSRDWFTRRWIVQEYVHARKLVFLIGYDTSYVVLDTMANFLQAVPIAIGLSQEVRFSLNFILLLNKLRSDFRQQRQSAWSLPALLAANPFLKTSNPRDTLYSMLSLGDDTTFRVSIDYEEASSDLSRRYALQLLSNGYWEVMLHYAASQNAHQLTGDSASSWGFSLGFAESTYRMDDARVCMTPEQVLFRTGIPSQEMTSLPTAPHMRRSPLRLCDHPSHTNCLCATVILTEKLLDLSGPFPPNRNENINANWDNDTIRDMSAAEGRWLIECVQLLRQLSGHETDTAASSTFWRTLMHDTWLEIHNYGRLEDGSRDLFIMWLEMMTERGRLGSNSLLGTSGSLPDSHPIHKADLELTELNNLLVKIEPINHSMSNLRSRRLAVSSGNHFCSVPGQAKAGDMVAVFKDTKMPFIVRPVGLSKFELVGSCYVHGIMYGESLRRGGNLPWEEIHIV